jgi:hypothetical protein
MIVRLSTSLLWAGSWHHSGDEVELPDDVAAIYIRAGSAEPIAPPIETAALQTTPPRGRRNERITTARRE